MPENENSISSKSEVIDKIRRQGHRIEKMQHFHCLIDDRIDIKILYSQRWNEDRTWYTGCTLRKFIQDHPQDSFVLFIFDDPDNVLVVPHDEIKRLLNSEFSVYHIFDKDGRFITRPTQGGLDLTVYLNNYAQFNS